MYVLSVQKYWMYRCYSRCTILTLVVMHYMMDLYFVSLLKIHYPVAIISVLLHCCNTIILVVSHKILYWHLCSLLVVC